MTFGLSYSDVINYICKDNCRTGEMQEFFLNRQVII